MPTSEAMMRYLHSEKGRETRRKYHQSDAGKATQMRYRSSEKGKGRRRLNWQEYNERYRKGKGKYNRRVRITLNVPIFVERDGDGYHSWSPLFKGLHTEGYCVNNAVANAKIATEAYIESMIEHGDPIPTKVENESI